mmetsp:Transcript_99164/g.248623  ORF Transcript_99164/g.248623 Transcript_99164/m.248623 type:complete len:224 (+) Transcript_99164:831-1502(+)
MSAARRLQGRQSSAARSRSLGLSPLRAQPFPRSSCLCGCACSEPTPHLVRSASARLESPLPAVVAKRARSQHWSSTWKTHDGCTTPPAATRSPQPREQKELVRARLSGAAAPAADGTAASTDRLAAKAPCALDRTIQEVAAGMSPPLTAAPRVRAAEPWEGTPTRRGMQRLPSPAKVAAQEVDSRARPWATRQHLCLVCRWRSRRPSRDPPTSGCKELPTGRL